MTRKYLAKGIFSFSNIINEDYIYVDKTERIYDLYVKKTKYHFLARPRRFGKSLLISTLNEIFQGNKDLFKGLWIYSSDFEFIKHPVIHLDFSGIAHSSAKVLKESLALALRRIADQYSITINQDAPIKDVVTEIIPKLAELNSVVLLVDEYDHPMISYINNNKEVAMENQKVLKDFYDAIKSQDKYFRAIFVTGVSKFSRTSIFSGFNNLDDISEDARFADLLGYTEEEISCYFSDFITDFAQQKQLTVNEIRSDMREWYNGYRFSINELKVYNPYSIVYYLDKQELENYWFESGTPTFLIELLSKDITALDNIEHKNIDSTSLKSWDLGTTPTAVILYQTGYLTIKGYTTVLKTRTYMLGYPNEEIRSSVSHIMVGLLINKEKSFVIDAFHTLKISLLKGDIPAFCRTFQSMLAGITYHHHKRSEAFYHALFEFVILGLGFKGESEVSTSKGRIDFVLNVEDKIYIFELKLNLSAEKAVKQIEDRSYSEKYRHTGKEIIHVGLSFNYQNKELSIDCLQKVC